MKKNFFLTLMLALVALFSIETATAQAPVAKPAEAITGLLTRIGGASAPGKFEIVIDANLAEGGKDVFIIAPGSSKPCIKGNNQLSVATGINWYLNHYAHINLTWNNLTTDLSAVTLPVPGGEEKHVSNAKYRYDFNTCTFSYSMAFWTWERWQQEIDWMALHGINAPLNLVGLDVVTRNFLKELGVSESDIDAYIAGPGFIAWFAMNNLEGWGGTINANDVTMNGNPDWWYTRQEQLSRNMLQRMRELGMQPVIPGYSGQVPNCITKYSIDNFNSGDVINGGTWAGGYTRPDIVKPDTESYRTLAAVYYKHLHEVMGVSELYSIDPFHEGGLPQWDKNKDGEITKDTDANGNLVDPYITNGECYPPIMVELDNYHNAVEDATKTSYNVGTEDNQAKWIIQYWQNIPQSGAFSSMESYGDRFIGLDLFADAPGKAMWNTDYYKGRPYIFCMLHNFGGRSGMHGRLESTMNDYFRALAKGNNCQGIGATPEGTETNPILYDMLFELPWMDVNNHPTADAWLAEYAYSRYGVNNATALEALKNLKKSVWACPTDQQGTSEAVILARPNWTIDRVSSWSTSVIYWDTQDVLLAADQLSSISDLITTADGIANYNYDFIDVVRQAMVDYAAQLLPLINAARNGGNNAEYTRLYQLYLQLMLDLDKMLSYDENFKLERWTSLARNIADEVDGTNENDRRWLEWNARTQVTVWSKGNTDLHDYSNRCWAGLIKDFHYKRWKYFFENNGNAPSGNWYSGFEYPWTVDFTNYNYSTVTIPNDMTATAKAKQTFGNYFGRVKGATKNYIFPMGVTTSATASDVIPEVYRDKTVELPLIIGKNVTMSSVWIDLNNDGAASDSENLAVTDGNKVAIPADAAIGKTKAIVTFSDGTVITFNIALIEDIAVARTVTAVAGSNGSVAIEGTNELSITTTDAVKMIATANTGYNFENWTDAGGNVVSNDNPFIYYGKEEATFTANFIQDRWGVPSMTAGGLNEAVTNNQYVSKIDFAYHNREAETIYDATSAAPTSLFTTIPQIIDVPQGASFTISWTDNGTQNLTKCFMSAYMDFNGNGNFEEEGELVKVVGTRNADNSAVRSNSFQVILPYDAPKGITHLRMRFDSAWGNQYNEDTKAFNSKGELNRMCYEIIINVTDFSDKAAHITVATNSEEWGTVKVWTDETPDGSTRTEWDVTKGVPFFMAAEKTSEDVEFLGWYDQYGRLVTENLEHKMYACEDATYTARFRKFLEIDGWQIEYRIQPGKDVVVGSALANGVKPEAGKKYYIYAPTNYNSVSATRYLYDNNGTLATNTTAAGNNYIWTCIVNNDGTYSFQNASGNYLANNGSYHLSIGATAAKYALEAPTTAGVAIKNAAEYTGGKYMVTKHDGSAFNRNGGKTNGEWCSDYVFTEVSIPDVIVFTKVRQNGVNDLVIPQTVEVLGEQLTIAGFDNDLFNNNNDLWSITLPSTIEFLGNNVIFESSLKGENTPVNNSDASPTELTQVIDLKGLVLKNSEPWKIEIKYSSDGVSSYNQWGSFLLCPGSTWGGAELLYLTTAKDNGVWHLRSPSSGLGNDYFKDHTGGKISKFTVTLENKGNGKAVIAVTNSEGATQTSTEFAFTVDNISAFCARIPKGLDITSFKIMDKEVVNPFSGCRNLDKIAIDGDCENYYVAQDGGLYNSSDVLVCMPEGKEKGADSRALAALIEEMETLTSLVATYNPVGKANKITLQTQDANAENYLWTNNADTAEGSIHHLVDGVKGNDDNFFHSNWHSVSTAEGYHYIEVDLGADNMYTMMQFAYHTRTNCSNDFPDAITVMGSNDKQNYTEIHTESSNLPQATNKEFKSAVFDCGQPYRYLRFKVTAERTYWHMGEFELYFMTSTADVYSYLEAGITNEQAVTGYDAMLDAQAVYDFGTTAKEMQDAKTELQSAYDTLKALLEAAIPVKLTTDEENPVLYKIISKRANDGSKVLGYDEPSGMVAVQGKADNSSWQAWYFMGSTNGVTIHPYNADGKVLSADNTGNAAAKVWAVEKGEKAFYEWKFVSRADGYFNIQAHDGSNYFSNNGGESNKMGFWSGSPDTDGGSLFKFVEAEFENKNARFYQMCDIKATMTTDGTNIYGGTSVGLYTGGKEYREAYTDAVALEAAGNTSASDECYATYKALRAANENLSYNAADPAKVYYIVSTATNGYCKGQYVHTYTEVQPSHNNYDHKDLVYHNFNNITTKTLAAFQFETTATQGEYKIKNLHTGLYVKSFAKNADHLGTEAEAQVVKIAGIADGQVTLKIGNADPMHAQDDNDCIVGWGAEANNASTWTINEVTDLAQLDYYFTVPASGVATLNLAFNAVLPQGVTAYAITGVRENGAGVPGYEMAQVAAAGDVLAKNTPVIIVANEGTHTFALTLSDEGAKTVQGTMMNGVIWQSDVAESENIKHYLPEMEDGVVVLKRVASNTKVANSAWVETTVDAESIKPYEEAVEDRFAGVYKITLETYYDDGYKEAEGESNLFVAYNEKKDDHSTVGYKMLVTGDNATTDAEADMYFTITEKDGGYSFQAQGMYLKKQQDWATQWRHSLFSEDENEAGVYLVEETDEPGILKIKGNDGNLPYLNAWDTGDVFIIGNNQAEMSAEFSFDPVTTYTLDVPEGGVTTLCLPFNVVLPAGVEAYDVNVVTEEGKCKYTLTDLAGEGDVLAKNTPVVIMATAGKYTLNITMDDNGAIPSATGSVLCGKYWERNLAAGDNNYQLAVTADGVVFNRVDVATTAAANTAWMKLSDDMGAVIYNEFTEIPEIPDAPALLTDGGVYRIKGRLSNGNFRTVYTNGVGNSLRWTSKEKNDATTLFVVQATVNGFKLVSALGDGLWNNDHALDEDGVELTLLPGTVNGTYAIRGNGDRIFSAFGLGEENNLNQYSGGDVKVDTTETTDFIFEKITDEKELAKVAFTKRIHKGNHFATLFLPYNVEVPEGVAAYTATIDDKDKDENGAEKVGYISLKEVEDGIIPARTAVILRREKNAAIGEFSFKYTTEAGSNYDDNLFGGRVTPGYVGSDNLNNGDMYYLLLNLDSKGEALYKVYREYYQNGDYAGENNGGYIKCDANKGYMKLNVALGASSSYIFRINGATGIEELEGEDSEEKVIYDLQGRKLTEITKPGFYIVNGEKVFVK